MARRGYSNVASALAVNGTLNNTDSSTIITTLTAPSGWPTAPFFAVIDQGTSSEELVYCTALTGSSFTCTRGSSLATPYGSTTKSHTSGATFKHVAGAADFDEANAHLNDSTRDDHTQYAKRGQGLASNVGVASRAGRLYIATDSEDLYTDDGTTVHRLLSKPSADAAYVVRSQVQDAFVATSQTQTSTAFADMTTAGPTATVTIGASGLALVTVSASLQVATAGQYALMAFVVDNGAVRTASDSEALISTLATETASSRTILASGITPGPRAFKAVYRVNTGTGTFTNRRITVIPL